MANFYFPLISCHSSRRQGFGCEVPRLRWERREEPPLRQLESIPWSSAFCSCSVLRQSLTSARAVVKGRLRGEIQTTGGDRTHLAPFTPSEKAEMRPGWPRLALRLLVRAVPAWPRGGLGWLHHEWPGVAKLLISAHFRSFPIIPLVRRLGFYPDPRLLPHGEGTCKEPGMRGSRIRGNDGGIRSNDVCEQCTGRGYSEWALSLIWRCWSYGWSDVTLGGGMSAAHEP